MFNSRFALVVLATTALVSTGLVVVLDAAPVTALFTGLAAGILAGVMPAAVRDGRFPGAHRTTRHDRGQPRHPRVGVGRAGRASPGWPDAAEPVPVGVVHRLRGVHARLGGRY
jgi:hypothetical protein